MSECSFGGPNPLHQKPLNLNPVEYTAEARDVGLLDSFFGKHFVNRTKNPLSFIL